MNRKKEREFILQALFAFNFEKKESDKLILDIANISEVKKISPFIEMYIDQAISLIEETDTIIKRHLENWDISRIAVVDLLLIRMAITEMMVFADIPPEVSINEVIELSKKYSGDGAPKFINGILDAILNELIKKGSLKKSARGAIKTSRAQRK